jgi:ubiquitin-conjugating enzyme E2 J2
MKPPGIMMLTPSGRFETGKRICLSMSDYHPETWNPVWNTETIITALISFMNSDERTTGCVVTSTQTKRNYAHLSLQFNMKDKEWASMFKPLFEKMGVEEKKIKKS